MTKPADPKKPEREGKPPAVKTFDSEELFVKHSSE